MNILEKIVRDKKIEIAQKKKIIPVQAWEMMPGFQKKARSLKKALLQNESKGIIAEFKRKSPSNTYKNEMDIEDVLPGYGKYASAVSVLTDEKYFGGTDDDILMANSIITLPVLRKDFIIDEYQVLESKGIGADVILLIAALHEPHEIKSLAKIAKSIGLEVLLEIHTSKELRHICDEVDLVGVNNRNLETFETNLSNSFELVQQIPKDKVPVSESGITSPGDYKALYEAGFRGFLMGSVFMKTTNPGEALKNFIEQI
ncbi:MAG: indole-3-glycerol phosphate synthase TrpC [Chitinophagaceae bacterium]